MAGWVFICPVPGSILNPHWFEVASFFTLFFNPEYLKKFWKFTKTGCALSPRLVYLLSGPLLIKLSAKNYSFSHFCYYWHVYFFTFSLFWRDVADKKRWKTISKNGPTNLLPAHWGWLRTVPDGGNLSESQ